MYFYYWELYILHYIDIDRITLTYIIIILFFDEKPLLNNTTSLFILPCHGVNVIYEIGNNGIIIIIVILLNIIEIRKSKYIILLRTCNIIGT